MDPKPPKPDGMGLINAASLLAKLADSADEEKESNSAQQSQSQSELYEKTQDGSLKCPKCTRTFPKLVALKSHIIMHSGTPQP